MSHAADVILRLHGPIAYAIVFLLPGLESSAFTGFVFPGEIAVLLGGVLAFQGRVSLPGIMAAAVTGTICGDLAGYAVGRHFGEHIFSTRLVRRLVAPERRMQAEEVLRRRGAPAIVLGRFTAVLRALVPGIAGMARMRYRTFLAAAVLGATLWAGSFTLLGYLGGDAWRQVEHVAAGASLLLGILLVLVAAVVLAARRVAANEQRLRAWWDGALRRPRVARFRVRYAHQIGFLYRRLDPQEALGLYLTIGLGLSVGAGWLFGATVQDVLAGEQLFVGDASLARFATNHRSAWFTHLLRDAASFGHPLTIAAVVLAAALLLAGLARSVRPGAFVVVAVAGGELLSLLVGGLVARPSPAGWLLPPPAYSFPSGHTVVAATLLGAVAFSVSVQSRSWAVRVWVWASALLLVVLVGLCTV
ncbi:MAG TPA: VTT domain-containing protein, partial [Actinomycetota bacterium]|nr:VTT domain-containing protein [Actinomycetota bacterium]